MWLASLFLAAAAWADQIYDNGDCWLYYYKDFGLCHGSSSGGQVISGLSFKIGAGGYWIIPSHIELPSTIDGVPVTAIGPRAFADLYGPESIWLPYSVSYIGDEAFKGCSGMNVRVMCNLYY